MKQIFNMRVCLLILLLFPVSFSLKASSLLMVRSEQPFDDALENLQTVIRDHGYTISSVQNIAAGMIQTAYSSGKYRTVLFGVPEEIKRLSETYPEMIPYLPLQIVVFDERGESLIASTNPEFLKKLFPNPELFDIYTRWSKDLQSILQETRKD